MRMPSPRQPVGKQLRQQLEQQFAEKQPRVERRELHLTAFGLFRRVQQGIKSPEPLTGHQARVAFAQQFRGQPDQLFAHGIARLHLEIDRKQHHSLRTEFQLMRRHRRCGGKEPVPRVTRKRELLRKVGRPPLPHRGQFIVRVLMPGVGLIRKNSEKTDPDQFQPHQRQFQRFRRHRRPVQQFVDLLIPVVNFPRLKSLIHRTVPPVCRLQYCNNRALSSNFVHFSKHFIIFS